MYIFLFFPTNVGSMCVRIHVSDLRLPVMFSGCRASVVVTIIAERGFGVARAHGQLTQEYGELKKLKKRQSQQHLIHHDASYANHYIAIPDHNHQNCLTIIAMCHFVFFVSSDH